MIILPQPLSWVELTTRIETADIFKVGKFDGETPAFVTGHVNGKPVRLGVHDVSTVTHSLHRTEVRLHICPCDGDAS